MKNLDKNTRRLASPCWARHSLGLKPSVASSLRSLAMTAFLFSLVTGALGLWGTAFADIPHLINYQGKLTDKDNKPIEGTQSVTFRIYDTESAGTLLWEETQSVPASKGIFSVMLGGVTALNLTFDKPYWLELKVGTEVMSPRQRMASVGYAIRAETAQNADAVSNISASVTPTANKLLPLDSNAKLPSSVLKVYDSGWVHLSEAQEIQLTHNLGTTRVMWQLYAATDGAGSGMNIQSTLEGGVGDAKGTTLKNITSNQCTISTTRRECRYVAMGSISDHQSQADAYYRVIGVVLE